MLNFFIIVFVKKKKEVFLTLPSHSRAQDKHNPLITSHECFSGSKSDGLSRDGQVGLMPSICIGDNTCQKMTL